MSLRDDAAAQADRTIPTEDAEVIGGLTDCYHGVKLMLAGAVLDPALVIYLNGLATLLALNAAEVRR